MTLDLDAAIHVKTVPASTEVYQRVRQHMRNLQVLREHRRKEPIDAQIQDATASTIRILEEVYAKAKSKVPRLDACSDDAVLHEAVRAREWLSKLLKCHDKVFSRQNEMRLFRSVVEKMEASRKLGLIEDLYITLSDRETPSPTTRLKAAFAMVLHCNLAHTERELGDRCEAIIARAEQATAVDAGFDKTWQKIARRADDMLVDNIACAIPLENTTKIHASVADDNAGCCSICHNSYTALKDCTVREVFADYPVRIKLCGHVVGKACLEQWLVTPKVDEAKYPYRTCPMCRVRIEDPRKLPKVPEEIHDYIKMNSRAMRLVHKLALRLDMNLTWCVELLLMAMSEEIAAEELLAEMRRSNVARQAEHKSAETFLQSKLAELNKEKRGWGFRGERVWLKLRNAWMDSGAGQRL